MSKELQEIKALLEKRQVSKEDIQEMLASHMRVIVAEKDAKYDIIMNDLLYIKEQTTKHNNRMSHLEEKQHEIELEQAKHISNCPNVSIINDLTNKVSFWIWWTAKPFRFTLLIPIFILIIAILKVIGIERLVDLIVKAL